MRRPALFGFGIVILNVRLFNVTGRFRICQRRAGQIDHATCAGEFIGEASRLRRGTVARRIECVIRLGIKIGSFGHIREPPSVRIARSDWSGLSAR